MIPHRTFTVMRHENVEHDPNMSNTQSLIASHSTGINLTSFLGPGAPFYPKDAVEDSIALRNDPAGSSHPSSPNGKTP